jgi:WD40 repeat protein
MMTPRFVRGWSGGLLALFVIASGIPAWPQEEAPPQEDRPRLILNTFGPREQLRALRFSDDSERLFAAGFDKVVHAWDVGWNQDDDNQPAADRITYVKTMRWETARGPRGAIQAMVASPERLAVAGYHMRNRPNYITLFDAGSYEVTTSLPTQLDQEHHTAPVISLDFSPNGHRLVSVCAKGKVIVWTTALDAWSSDPIRTAGDTDRTMRPAIFLTNDECVYADRNRAGAWEIRSKNLQTKKFFFLPERYVGGVKALCRLDNEWWAAASGDGKVRVRKIKPNPLTPNPSFEFETTDPHITSLSIGPQGWLAVATSGTLDATASASHVELWDLNIGQRIDRVQVSQREHCQAVTISKDGQRLATHDADSDEVLVFRLREDTKPPIRRPAARARGVGRRVTQVAFSAKDNLAIRISQDSRPTQVFDFTKHLLRDVDNLDQWRVTHNKPLGGWRLDWPQRGPLHNLLLLHASGQWPINLSPAAQGQLSAYSFIHRPRGQVAAVAIGTSLNHGVFVYSLPRGREPPRLLRHFRDHIGTITSLATSADGRFLASASKDQTVKIWSLDRLFDEDTDFRNSAAWGASFQIEGGRVVIRDVNASGILHARGLRDGDVIAKVQAVKQPDITVRYEADSGRHRAATILQLLRDAAVLYEVTLSVQGKEPIRLRPAWEPLLTLFVDARDEWAVWHPEGYFSASVAEGGELFGWQIDHHPRKPPKVYKADFLQKTFERPNVIRDILRRGSLNDALSASSIEHQPLPETVALLPQVKINYPLAGAEMRSGELTKVKATITLPPGTTRDDFEIRGAINRGGLGEPTSDIESQPGVSPAVITLEWDAKPQDSLNHIEVSVSETLGALNSFYKVDSTFIRGHPEKRDQYNLHFLGLASANYNQIVGPLPHCKKDVADVITALNDKHSVGLARYKFKNLEPLYDEGITLKSVGAKVQEVQALLEDCDRQDVLVVYLSGHGFSEQGEYYYAPTSLRNKLPATIKKQGIPWSVLSGFADVECQVIWILDTCHSGEAVNAIDDSKRDLSLVFAAVTGSTSAKKFDAAPHAIFTQGILDGLRGAADGEGEGIAPDNQLTVLELIRYVPRIVSRQTVRQQNPCATPDAVAQITELPLMAVQERDFESLFDGETFEGWEGDVKMFRIQEGAIVGGNLKKRIAQDHFLCTKKKYQDFELRLLVKLNWEDESRVRSAGIRFRGERITGLRKIKGYECDMGRNREGHDNWGALFGLPFTPKQRAAITGVLWRKEWNDLRIRCQGKSIEISLNGHQTISYDNAELTDPGVIALQIETGEPAEVSFRQIRIKQLGLN